MFPAARDPAGIARCCSDPLPCQPCILAKGGRAARLPPGHGGAARRRQSPTGAVLCRPAGPACKPACRAESRSLCPRPPLRPTTSRRALMRTVSVLPAHRAGCAGRAAARAPLPPMPQHSRPRIRARLAAPRRPLGVPLDRQRLQFSELPLSAISLPKGTKGPSGRKGRPPRGFPPCLEGLQAVATSAGGCLDPYGRNRALLWARARARPGPEADSEESAGRRLGQAARC